MSLKSREERQAFLESIGLDADSVESILDADDKPETVHEFSTLNEVLSRADD